MDEGKAFDVLYLDSAKAFDKVDHGRLMKKIEAIGIRGKLKEWIWDWLTDRRQESKSGWKSIGKGRGDGQCNTGVGFG